MTRSEFARALTDAGLPELEVVVHFLWFRGRFEGELLTSPSEIWRFFHDEAIGHPNLARLRQRIHKDGRILVSANGCRLRPAAIKQTAEFHDRLRAGGAGRPAAGHLAGLLSHAQKIRGEQTRVFLLEAIACAQVRSFRAAVLLSWCGAIFLLQERVFQHHLAAFNADGVANGLFTHPIESLSDLRGALRDGQFIEVLRRISVIDESEKRALGHCLDRRDACGHPSEFRLEEAAVADHLESLMLNVFDRYGGA